ncbi:MAG: hypothetical protein AB8F95_04385 [Bacteroidia bacterium]
MKYLLILAIVPWFVQFILIILAVRGYNRGWPTGRDVTARIAIWHMILSGITFNLPFVLVGYFCLNLTRKDIHPKRIKQ